MRAAVYYGPGDVRFENRPDPIAADGELVIDVATVGICGTDAGEFSHEPHFFPIYERHPFSGHQGPTIPGHEFSGVVASVGPGVQGFEVGDPVASGAGVSCGRCGPCLRGATNMCDSYWTIGLHRDGAMAERVAVPASCCLNLNEYSVSFDVAALAQPMSIAVHASRQGGLRSDDNVLILGTGGIGTFLTYVAAASGARVTAVDLDPDRLAVASALGAARTIHASDIEDLPTRLAEDVALPSLVFECTADAASLQLAVSAVAQRGRIVIVGHHAAPVSLDVKHVSFGERQLIGTMAHAFGADFAEAMRLVSSAPDLWSSVAPTVYPIEGFISDGLDPMLAKSQSQIKTLFDPSITGPRSFRSDH